VKKIVKILLIVLILSMASISHAAEPFSDVGASHWAYDSIQWGVQNKLISGFPDGTYRPSDLITEEQFATMFAKYIFKDKNLQNAPSEEKYYGWSKWSDTYYDEMLEYSLPFSGYDSHGSREAPLLRGELARLVAAKNGFNLDYRQAVYYMYENDISYGLEGDKLTFNSYGKDIPVKREQIPAFMQRLEDGGNTTFMGKSSPVTGSSQIAGIRGVPRDTTIITDEMFDELARKKGITNPPVVQAPLGTFENPIVLSSSEVSEGIIIKLLNEGYDKDVGGLVVNVDGVLIPAVPQITGYNMGEILATRYVASSGWLGYKDKDTFFKVVDTWRGTILDDRQVDLIYEFESKWIGTKGSSEIYIVKGSKYDMELSATYSQVNIAVVPKGALDGIGFTVLP
jgi:hypothetical protein